MLKKYFELSKKEFNGIIVLISLLLILALVPYVYNYFKPAKVYDNSQFEKEVKEFLASREVEEKENSYKRKYPKIFNYGKPVNPVYFKFDPNNLPEGQWLKLGLSERQVRNIKNYESKGGRFFKKEDLKKLYTISPADYARLEPYIKITAKEGRVDFVKRETGNNTKALKVDINFADSAEVEKLRGIGPAFASRIVRYRNRIGGFYKKEQLLEVFGLDSVRYMGFENQISINPEGLVKTNINNATFNDLKRYPYLSYKQINALLQYRKQHGNYNSADDLKKVLIITNEIVEKLSPYLTY